MAAGYKVGVHNNSTGNITVARATGADTINGATKNIVLPSQQRANFRVNAAATGYLIEDPTGGLFLDPTDPSKQAKWDLSGVTTGTVITLTPPAAGGTLVTSASLTAANGCSMVLLGSKTASSSASISFAHTAGTGDVLFDWTAYDEYEFHFVQIVPATNAVLLGAQISEDSGSTYKNGVGAYEMTNMRSTSGLAPNPTIDTGTATNWSINYNSNQGNGTDYGLSGKLVIIKPSSTVKKNMVSHLSFLDSGGTLNYLAGIYRYTADSNAWTGIKFIYNSGAIASGTIYAYGIKKS